MIKSELPASARFRAHTPDLTTYVANVNYAGDVACAAQARALHNSFLQVSDSRTLCSYCSDKYDKCYLLLLFYITRILFVAVKSPETES